MSPMLMLMMLTSNKMQTCCSLFSTLVYFKIRPVDTFLLVLVHVFLEIYIIGGKVYIDKFYTDRAMYTFRCIHT